MRDSLVADLLLKKRVVTFLDEIFSLGEYLSQKYLWLCNRTSPMALLHIYILHILLGSIYVFPPFSCSSFSHLYRCSHLYRYRRDKLLSPRKMGSDLGQKCCARMCLRAFTVHQLQEERARFVAKIRTDQNNHIVTMLQSFKVRTTAKGRQKR